MPSRREFLHASAASALALSSTLRTLMSAASRPNIVFLFSDDHSLQSIGAYKTRLQRFVNQHELTPNLNRLAAGGATTKDGEWAAAMRYFSGSTNPQYSFYGDSVVARAESYQEDIDKINK